MAEETSIRIKCPSCGALGRGKASQLGREMGCPKCGKIVRFVHVPTHKSAKPEPSPEEGVIPSQRKVETTEPANVSHIAPTRANVLTQNRYIMIAAYVAAIALLSVFSLSSLE